MMRMSDRSHRAGEELYCSQYFTNATELFLASREESIELVVNYSVTRAKRISARRAEDWRKDERKS